MSSLKPLAEDVTKIFQCIFSHVRAYYRVLHYYTGLNFFWVIDNNANAEVRWIASVRKVMPAVFPPSISRHSIPKSPTINFCNVFNFSLIWSLMIRTERTFLVPILEPTVFEVQDVLIEGTLRTRCHLHLSF